MKKVLLNNALLLIALAVSSNAMADSLDVNLVSWHSDRNYDYNTENFGLGYTKMFDKNWSGKVGFYDNSYNKASVYALASFNDRYGDFSVGFDAGFVTGYDNVSTVASGHKDLNKYQFVIYPTATWHINKKHALTGGIIPALDSESMTVIGIQYRYTL